MQKQISIKFGQPGSMEYILRSQLAKSAGGLVKMAPGIAKRILEELNFPGQRDIRSSRVYSKHLLLVTGDWMESYPIDFASLPDGRIWLVDGHHRLTAISEQDAPVPITIRLIEVDTEDEARKLYAGYDMSESVRTTKQILDAVGIAKQLGITGRIARAVFECAPILLNDMEPMVGSANILKAPHLYAKQKRMEVICDWAKEAKEFESIIAPAAPALKAKLKQVGPLAVGLYTLRHQPARAKEFWSGIANNDGLRRADPRATLIQDYLTRASNLGSVRQRVQQTSLAWNAFCEGRDLKIIKCIVDAQITLWGTPIKAKK